MQNAACRNPYLPWTVWKDGRVRLFLLRVAHSVGNPNDSNNIMRRFKEDSVIPFCSGFIQMLFTWLTCGLFSSFHEPPPPQETQRHRTSAALQGAITQVCTATWKLINNRSRALEWDSESFHSDINRLRRGATHSLHRGLDLRWKDYSCVSLVHAHVSSCLMALGILQ